MINELLMLKTDGKYRVTLLDQFDLKLMISTFKEKKNLEEVSTGGKVIKLSRV